MSRLLSLCPYVADAGALGLDRMTRILASVYMIIVTVVLLNLLISIISESYDRIRQNERWESLRNKAVLIVQTETHVRLRAPRTALDRANDEDVWSGKWCPTGVLATGVGPSVCIMSVRGGVTCSHCLLRSWLTYALPSPASLSFPSQLSYRSLLLYWLSTSPSLAHNEHADDDGKRWLYVIQVRNLDPF
jgi:hypothetical protein